ncbi:hypothetical protein JDF658_19130 [Carboxydocella sp. JDF658]|nr:hypothetical protein JDF658_19130 [Carboxydocella sp. JDF658]
MKVKRFVAPTVNEAMLKVRNDMGRDAVIIHTRKFREGGFFGLFGRQMVEVTAAVEEKISSPPVPSQPVEIQYKQINVELKQEIHELKEKIDRMAEIVDEKKIPAELSEEGKKYWALLQDKEVEENILRKIFKQLRASEEESQTEEEKILHVLEKYFKKGKPITVKKNKNKERPLVVSFIGPTGVGKTTTIAKIAANFAIKQNFAVALLTSDTYRVAAVEQLKTYGDIMGLPVEVVYSPKDMKEAIEKHQDKDLLLIDTAGRSHRNKDKVVELKSFIAAAQPDETYLVLSAPTKRKDMLEIVENYRDIEFDKIILTKIDETSSFGGILSVLQKTRKPLVYVTTGQEVPDDISEADPTWLAGKLIKER